MGQNALVLLKGFSSIVRTTARNESNWLDMINTKNSIGSAISKTDSDDMSFQRWLITAIQEKLIQQFTQR